MLSNNALPELALLLGSAFELFLARVGGLIDELHNRSDEPFTQSTQHFIWRRPK
jgi:hypothetical protein